MKTTTIAAIVALMIAVASLSALQPVEQREVGNRSAANHVAIISEQSRYKERLIDAVVEALDDGQTYIEIRGLDDLPQIDPRDYDSVLVINAGVGAEVRPGVVAWLDRQTHDENIVVLTTQITDWTPQISVDSVTSASRSRNIPEVSADLVRRVRGNF